MASTVDGQAFAPNQFDLPLNLALPSPPEVSPDLEDASCYQRNYVVAETQPEKGNTDGTSGIDSTTRDTGETLKPSVQSGAAKPRRVRTGCLTCRERHLKCDEAVPYCQNCVKSESACRRGVRLNFIDTQVAVLPYSFRLSHDSNITFCDESRDVASEYVGGYERYPSVNEDGPGSRTSFSCNIYTPADDGLGLQTGTPLIPPFPDRTQVDISGQIFQSNSQTATPGSTLSNHTLQRSPFGSSKQALTSSEAARPYLNTAEEVLLMHVFVEEVGLWMDSMDSMKHFTNILPFHALSESMLLHAFLACGARHLFLVNPSFGEEKALYYYNISTRDLLNCLQNPNRDTVLCATTAVVLNVYEIMCERAMHRMNHIAGARALIKECNWDAKSTGIGGACFWLNVGMELLSCLHFNWKMAWDPDTWNIDMDMAASMGAVAGDEELWTNRMVYICAKIAGFRSTVQQFQNLDPVTQESSLAHRCQEWSNLKAWCDEWARCVPRSMQPLGYLQPWQRTSKSSFPEVWLIKRSAIVGRLFYHTSCCLLSRLHPVESEFSEEILRMRQSHAHDICGIVAHVKDRGVASVSLRCLAIAAECLVDRTSQEEVIDILDRTIKETGWQVAFLQRELIEKWGWNSTVAQVSPAEQQPPPSSITTSITTAPSADLGSSLLNSSIPGLQTRPPPSQGIVNPLMASADFSFEEHPYQAHYVAPQSGHLGNYHYGPYAR